MQRSDFEHAVTLGLGRIIQHLQSHEAADYTDIILKACLHCTAYDPQIEGTHAEYLHEVITLTQNYDYFRDQILATLAAAASSADWDYIQLIYLASNIAAQGYQPARDALYARFDRDIEAGFTDIVFLLLGLDGLPVLKLIAEYGEIEWDYFSLAIELEDHDLNEVSMATAAHPAFQAALISAIDKLKNREPVDRAALNEERRKRFAIPYTELQDFLSNNQNLGVFGKFGFLQGWGQYASDEDLRLAAQELLIEQNYERLEHLTNIFAKRSFPLDPVRLIAIVRQRDNYPESRLSVRAKVALTHLSNSAVRNLALEFLNSDQPDWGIDLLEKNFEEGDWTLINSAITARTMTRDVYHGLGMGIRKLALKHPLPEAAISLTTLYERTPCSHCRERIVEALHKLDLLPAPILEECKYDSNHDLRRLAQNGFIETGDN